jgi:histone-lysine N-methyltransferase MLL3
MRGDAAADGPARLLNYDVDKWVHLNCALWSEEVYETVSGALVNCETALKNGANTECLACEKNFATIKCFKTRCTNIYHLGCAVKEKATFYKNKTVFCKDHQLKGEKDNELTTLAVYRRVYIERDENRQVANVMATGMETHHLRVGSLTFLNVGQLMPHQMRTFHTEDFIFPIGYKILRYYWSMRNVNKRCNYICSVEDNDNKPEFVIDVTEAGNDPVTFRDESCMGVWMQVLIEVEKVRKTADCTKVFPAYITGEELFGFNEPNVVKVLESLPGIESLKSYIFKYGRNPMLELPLAVNPTGCARSEAALKTHVKLRGHNFQRTGGPKSSLHRDSKEMVPFLVGLEAMGPYSKNFVQSKASQYRKMKQEWRQNVVLARSKIAGLGLYAARDLERGQMIIEYIGEVIRFVTSKFPHVSNIF